MEQDEIIEKIRRYMEEKLELEDETCYFITKKLNEGYWEIIQSEEEPDEETQEDEDEFSDFEDGFEESDESEDYEEDLEPEPTEEKDIATGKTIKNPPPVPQPPREMSTKPKLRKIPIKKPSLFGKKQEV